MDSRLRRLKRLSDLNPELLPDYIAALEQTIGGVNLSSLEARHGEAESILRMSVDAFIQLVIDEATAEELGEENDYSGYHENVLDLLEYGANGTIQHRDYHLRSCLFILESQDVIYAAVERLVEGWGAWPSLAHLGIPAAKVRNLLEQAKNEGFDYLLVEAEN